jgi:hypothetical protein
MASGNETGTRRKSMRMRYRDRGRQRAYVKLEIGGRVRVGEPS